MKRILSSVLMITTVFVFACNSHSANYPVSGTPPDPTIKTVAIIIVDGSDLDPVITVVPDPIKIKVNDKIKWVVSNNRGDGSVSVKIDTFIVDGTTTPENPFKSGSASFDLNSISSGASASYPTGDNTTAVRKNTYKYTIHATVTSSAGTVTTLKDLDPRVVISGG